MRWNDLFKGIYTFSGQNIFKRHPPAELRLQKPLKLFQNETQALDLVLFKHMCSATRLNSQGMGPMTAQYTHDMQPLCPRLQYLGQDGTFHRGKTRLYVHVPRCGSIVLMSKIGHEKQVEMGQVVCGILTGQHQILRPYPGRWRCDTCRFGNGKSRRSGLGNRANPADPWGVHKRISYRPPGQQPLKPAKQSGIHISMLHDPMIQLKLNFQISFHTVERPQLDTTIHSLISLISGDMTGCSAVAFLRNLSGVAALASDDRAINQAFGMSVGRPTGIPPSLGVC